MRTIIWFIRAFFYMIFAIPKMLSTKKLRETDQLEKFQQVSEDSVRQWAQTMMRYAGVTIEVHGSENLPGVPAVYIPNHQSDWDIPMVLGYLDRPYPTVAKKSISNVPLIRTWMSFIHCVFIDRDNARTSLRAMNEIGSGIPEGRSVIIFAEGKRSKSEEVNEFMPGAFKIAFKYKVPVVPIAIDGSYKVMEANNGKWIKPSHVIMTILPPVETKDLDKAQQKEFPEEIRQIIIAGREKTRNEIKEQNENRE